MFGHFELPTDGEAGRLRYGTAGDAQRLFAQGAVTCCGELFELSKLHHAQSFETPESAKAEVVRSLLIHHDSGEFRRQRNRVTIHNFLPRGVDFPRVCSAKVIEQLIFGRLVEIRQICSWRLRFMAHPPDAAAGLVAFGMVPRDLVVRNYFVIPVHDVKAAVRTEVN